MTRSGCDEKQPVVLVSCETGKKPAAGGDPIGQLLADERGVPVTAPDEKTWLDKFGRYRGAGPIWFEGENFKMMHPIKGANWKTFYPRK